MQKNARLRESPPFVKLVRYLARRMNTTCEIVNIPLNKLVASPRNVRKTGGQTIDDLAASVRGSLGQMLKGEISLDLRSAKEFWDEARQKLGYTREYGYDQELLWREGAACFPPKDVHARKCEDLSRQIAIETGQAKDLGNGLIEFKYGHSTIFARCWIEQARRCLNS